MGDTASTVLQRKWNSATQIRNDSPGISSYAEFLETVSILLWRDSRQ
ncbi:hypothetical protein PM8797T_18776 [Gimesia maris DSM 8797]|nr:hypothetical protein PM8797T_18776 [Gimesia maris DSM 8797]